MTLKTLLLVEKPSHLAQTTVLVYDLLLSKSREAITVFLSHFRVEFR